MSVMEDTRKLLQDFLAPEVRELTARVESLEKRMDIRFDALEKRVDARADALEKQAEARAGSLEERTRARAEAVERRMDDLEAEVKSGFAAVERLASERHTQTLQAIARLSDIYELRERISRIEAREKTN